jgi:hypothetical protein
VEEEQKEEEESKHLQPLLVPTKHRWHHFLLLPWWLRLNLRV